MDALIDILPTKRAAVVAFIVATSATYPSEVAPVTRAMVDEKTFTVRVPGTKRTSRDRTLVVPSHARGFLTFALEHARDDSEDESEAKGTLFQPWGNIRGDLHGAARLLSMCKTCRRGQNLRPTAKTIAAAEGKPPCKACQATPTFDPLSPNDLRRTFAQWLVRSGVPYELAYPLLGHDSPRMLERVYGKRDATSVADLVELALKRAPKNARKADRLTGGHRVAPTQRHGTNRTGLSGLGSAPVSPALSVPRDGIEPPTRGFSIPCSTN